jgi:hypothetical protein
VRFYIKKGHKRVGYVEWEWTDRSDGIGRLVRVFVPKEHRALGRDIERRLRRNNRGREPIYIIGGHRPDDASIYIEAIPVAIERALREYKGFSYESPKDARFRLNTPRGMTR